MSHVLVTGFEPWGKIKVNPSGLLALEAGGVVLPTAYRACERALLAAVAERRPRAVVMLGLAEGRKRLGVERIAVNRDHADLRDTSGERRLDRAIEAGGPLALETRLPAGRLLEALRRARVPAAYSFHAGTFCCNHVFYVALRRLRAPCGFVHVPPFKMVPFAVQKRGVAAIVRVLEGHGAARH